jgi:uncharacterized membrane protein YeaQ/YmgE (transglycosylase-associated protein family)
VPVVVLVLLALVVVFVVGWIVVGLVLKLLWWALVGVAIGAIARAILPGKQDIGLLATAGSGIGAALLGGIIAHIVGVGSFVQFLIALLVAVVIVAIVSTSARPGRA